MNISANWVPFLKQDTTNAPIIRTTQERAFVIYMMALSEWADIYDSRYEKFADELEFSNRQPLLGSVLSLLNFHQRCVVELVRLFNTDEMKLIAFCRHNFVHGSITGHWRTKQIKHYAAELYSLFKQAGDENPTAFYEAMDRAGGVRAITALFDRFLDAPSALWLLLDRTMDVSTVKALDEACHDSNANEVPLGAQQSMANLPLIMSMLHRPIDTLRPRCA